MGPKNSQIHILLETNQLNSLKLEAKNLNTNISDLVRSKLSNPPASAEILLLRKFRKALMEMKNG